MTIWLCRLTKTRGQTRLTVPKGLVEKKEFFGGGYVELDDNKPDQIIIRRHEVNGKKTVDRTVDSSREDR